jgi:hypothetical protein
VSFSASRLRLLLTAWWIPLSIVLGLATWPFRSVQPSQGLDDSWQIALHLAASRGLDFGHDLVFTYGPLGFLLQPVLAGGSTGTASVLVTLAAHMAFCALLLRGALQSLSPPLAIAVVYAVTGVLASIGYGLVVSDYLVFFVLFLAVWIIERKDPPPAVFIAVGALAAAAQLLVKLNGGVLCILMLAFVVWRCRPGGLRSLAVLAVSYLGFAAVLWLAAGNNLSDLPTWIRLSRHLATAYAGSMALEVHGRSREYVEAGFAAFFAATAVALRLRTLDRARAASVAGVLLVYGFGYWKEGFVRHDVHALALFAAGAVALLAFGWKGPAGIAASAALVVAVVASATAIEWGGGFPFHPVRSATAAGTALGQTLLSDRRDRAIAGARELVRARLGVEPSTLAELRGATVAVEPYETSAVWAYGLDWRPELLLQQYVSGDAELDSANAGALAQRGAERVLRQELWPALDGKHPLYEAPSTFMALVCRYRQLSSTGSWAVFARGANRCGMARLLASTTASAGTTVSVPSAPTTKDIVLARIRVRETILQRFERLLLKRKHEPSITVDSERYRLIPATAAGPLILRMPVGAGMSASVGGAVDYSHVSVTEVPSARIDFYAVPLTSSWRGPAPLAGTLTAQTVTVGRQRAPIVSGALAGRVEQIVKNGGAATISGWAIDVGARAPAEKVLVFSHGRLIGRTSPSITRFDVMALYKSSGVFYSGFSVLVPAADVGSLTVVALSHSRASVLANSVHP